MSLQKYWLKTSINDESWMDNSPPEIGCEESPPYYLASEVDSLIKRLNQQNAALRISINKIVKFAAKEQQAAYDGASDSA